MQGRIGSATESAAAHPVLAEVLSTNLPKKPLNQLAEKQFWQACASAFSPRSMSGSGTRSTPIRRRQDSTVLCVRTKTSHRIPAKAGVPNQSGSGELLRPFPSSEKDVAPLGEKRLLKARLFTLNLLFHLLKNREK